MSILKNILLTSLGALVYHNSEIKAEPVELSNDKLIDFDRIISFSPKKDLTLKLRLILNTNGDWILNSHASHSSHASHASHYSSQGSGGHYSHTSHYSSTTSTTSGSSTSSSSYSSSGSNTNNNYSNENVSSIKVYNLGDRILTKGMKGTDVTELANILIAKKYLTLNDGSTTVVGSYEFNQLIFNAVKQFQKDQNLTNDGVVGPKTVYYLKK